MFHDFIYDGIILSNMGYTVCSFGEKGSENSVGSTITFNTIPLFNGAKHELISTNYDNCLECTFQICKNPCNDANLEISMQDFIDLSNWLNRKNFHKFKFINDDYYDLYFEASFNLSRIEINGKICGVELHMITNRPFALREPIRCKIKNIIKNGNKNIMNDSCEEGFIYPNIKITMVESGDFCITNLSDGERKTIVKNVVAGEIIEMNYPMITSSIESHKIQNDFNWKFFRLVNSFYNRKNNIVISIPCEIEITYSPVVKVGI